MLSNAEPDACPEAILNPDELSNSDAFPKPEVKPEVVEDALLFVGFKRRSMEA